MKELKIEKNFKYEVDFNMGPTNFAARLLKFCLDNEYKGVDEFIDSDEFASRASVETKTAQIHVILKKGTAKNKLKVGDKLKPVIENEKGELVQFAPILKAESIQEIKFDWSDGNNGMKSLSITIDKKKQKAAKIISGMISFASGQLKELSINSGFSSVDKFLNYYDKTQSLEIVHFSDFKYDLSE